MSHDALNEFKTFGDALKYLRRRAHLTLRELGIAVGYSEAHVARLESNQRLPDVATISSRFVEALHLKDEPDLARRLIRLAAQSRGDSMSSAVAQTKFPIAISTERSVHPPTNLPHLLTRFIGRDRELADVQRLVGANRLVTLIGPGGAGKTRLAQETASRITTDFPDGVWLVELAPLTSSELLADTILMIFGVRPANQSARLLLIEHLRGKNALLILDNCEHLIEDCAQLTEAMLRACPNLRILATSREPLNVPGETTWRMPSLVENEAIQIFVNRAHAAKPDFQLTVQNRETVTHICAQLDNMPLAIELAASRLSALSADQILVRLKDRFRLLISGARTALPRHQTLWALIDWSYNLLSSDEQRLLRWLSVFAGGWTLELAERMFGDFNTIDVLAQLVDKSLVNLDDHTDVLRYTMLETIRQFGQDKLIEVDEQEQARRRHLDLMLSLAEEAKMHHHGPLEKCWFDQIEHELDNLRAALKSVIQTRDLQMALRMLEGVRRFWVQRGYQAEGIKWVEAILLLTDSTTVEISLEMQVKGLIAISLLSFAMGDNIRSEAACRDALPLAYQLEDEQLIFVAQLGIGWLTADYTEAISLLTHCLEVARRTDNNVEDGVMLGWALQTFRKGDLAKATELLNDALAIVVRDHDYSQISAIYHQLGLIALQSGNSDEARKLFEMSVVAGQKAGAKTQIANTLTDVAALDVRESLLLEASNKLDECMHEYYRVGNIEQIGHCLSVAAGISQARGNLPLAANLLGKTFAIRHVYSRHGIFDFTIYWDYEYRLPLVRAAMASSDFELAFAEGQQMSLQQAMELVASI